MNAFSPEIDPMLIKQTFYSRFFPRGDTALKPPRKAAQAIVGSASMLGSGPRGRHVLRFHAFHLACCPRRAQIGTWFLGVLMFHCSRPVLPPPSSCAWLAALDVHRSVTWLLGDLMFHCSRPVLLPSPSYACVPSRPARRQSLHVRSLRRRLELVHSNTWVLTFSRRSSSNFRG